MTAKKKETSKLPGEDRSVRVDKLRNLKALIETAKEVFATSGVDAPVREIAEKAGVGLGTVYRHFPQRADLIAAVFRHEVDACSDAAAALVAEHESAEALALWIQHYADFLATKKGLAPALRSGDPAYENLRSYFDERVRPALEMLLERSVKAGKIRSDANADDILSAVAGLCMSAYSGDREKTRRMIGFFVDGLRYGAKR
ncbi:MAG TPA: TetR/AcrR family transcriptional regulator [Oculatellaceae cyanobacterium]